MGMRSTFHALLTKSTVLLSLLVGIVPVTTLPVIDPVCMQTLAYALGVGAQYGARWISSEVGRTTAAQSDESLEDQSDTRVGTSKFIERSTETFAQLIAESLLTKLLDDLAPAFPPELTVEDLLADFASGMRTPVLIELGETSLELLKDMWRLLAVLGQKSTLLLAVLVQKSLESMQNSLISSHCHSYSLQYPLAGPQGHSTILTCGPQDPYCLKQPGPMCSLKPLEEYINQNAHLFSDVLTKEHIQPILNVLRQLGLEVFVFTTGALLAVVSYSISIWLNKIAHTPHLSVQATDLLARVSPLIARQLLIFIEKVINNSIDVFLLDPVREEFLQLIEQAEILERDTSTALVNIKDVRDTLATGEKGSKIVKLGSRIRQFRNPFAKFLSNVMYGNRRNL